MQRKLHQGCNMCDNFSRQFHDMTCQFCWHSNVVHVSMLFMLDAHQKHQLGPQGLKVIRDGTTIQQCPYHRSIVFYWNTDHLIPRTGRVLASKPVEDFQITIRSSSTTHRRIPRTRWLKAYNPLEDLQLPVLSSSSTRDLIPWTGGVLASEPLEDF